MGDIYSETFALRTCHCDLHGDWRPSSILEFMQETAGAHCARLGAGRALTDALGVVWVLSRTRVEMRRVPRLGESVTVQTWPLAPKHLFFPRLNAFLGGDGEVLGRASSLWVLLDVAGRRIVSREAVAERLPDNRDVPVEIAMPASVRPLPGEAAEGELLPGYPDFDVNGHVNNTRCLDWCCGALDHGVMAEHRVTAFDVNYDAEILPGTQIETGLVRDGLRFSFCGQAGGRRCFGIAGTLSSRE